ncbi:SDR family NAD(P)-dependent oxidoreductase [Microvirga sp. CF3016]|uniref:SDR family NAD(P)-dependent oxidoreductase n=1 Tax=Microvirga sp. CF3016 TaxID=3110181 RepID=UPI002E7622EB|nr:SDR family oxidoreductase [Microvirga sp. CF3016]MEE1610165.1 SDR family oxidoreductase [Microvirga sp. CF3016]
MSETLNSHEIPRNPRIVLVTGSSRGVGRGLVEALLAEGDYVYGCSRSGQQLIEHKRYRHVLLDVANEAAVRKMLNEIVTTHGRLDVVVNNAGVSSSRLGLLTPASDFMHVLEANLVGAFIVMRESIRLMKRTKFGRIINFSSINVPLASVGGASYNASKAALENLCITLSRECASDDITINCLGLSLVGESGMVDALPQEALAAKQQQLIKPALLSVRDVLHAVNFFASPNARNITGQTIYFGGVS